jgi:trehalose 2-sulfotransferase
MRASLVRLVGHVSTLRTRIEAAGVERTFLVCSTPRTGSTMLGNLLADTGLAGRAGEYFGEVFRRDVVPGLSRRRFDDYLVDCTRHARGTGALGIKLHWDQVEVFLHLLRLRRGLRGSSDRQVVDAVFPAPRFVWMTREDTLAQAVSWWKAMTSGKWTDGRPVTGEPTFDFDGIAGRVRRIDEHTEAWRHWFETNEIEPLRLTYEELAADPAGTARRVLAFVGVDVPTDLAVAPHTEQQADAVNEDWIRRYRKLAGERSSRT